MNVHLSTTQPVPCCGYLLTLSVHTAIGCSNCVHTSETSIPWSCRGRSSKLYGEWKNYKVYMWNCLFVGRLIATSLQLTKARERSAHTTFWWNHLITECSLSTPIIRILSIRWAEGSPTFSQQNIYCAGVMTIIWGTAPIEISCSGDSLSTLFYLWTFLP